MSCFMQTFQKVYIELYDLFTNQIIDLLNIT